MDVLIAACGGAFVAGIFGLVTQLLQQRAKRKDKAENKDDVVKNTLKVMLLDRVKYLGHAYIKKGEVDFDDRRLLHQMHDAYTHLGGNGDLNLIIHEVDRLPLKES